MTEISARGMVDGEAQGIALVTPAISFLGDIDVRSGTIVGDLPEVKGECVTGRLLLMPFTRGSAGAGRVIYALMKLGKQPCGIIVDDLPDPSFVQGAILANIPVACQPKIKTSEFAKSGEMWRLVSKDGKALIQRVSD